MYTAKQRRHRNGGYQYVMPNSQHWSPTRFERFESANDGCSTKVAIIQTDAGRAYLKALGNPEGPHALAREWVGTSLARWFGLPTFDFSIIQLEPGIDVPLGGGILAEPGSAFVTRAAIGDPWSGTKADLKKVVNPWDFTMLVILDTWLLNADRHPPDGNSRKPNYDNVFLEYQPTTKKKRLIAMDFTECLKTGSRLGSSISNIHYTKDPGIYGFFPEFSPFLDGAVLRRGLKQLEAANKVEFEGIVNRIPMDWDVADAVRSAIVDFLMLRAGSLVEHLPGALHPFLGKQTDLPLE